MKRFRSSASSKSQKSTADKRGKKETESCRSSSNMHRRDSARSVSCETLVMDNSSHELDDWGMSSSKRKLSAVSRRRILERRNQAAVDKDRIDSKLKLTHNHGEKIYTSTDSTEPFSNCEKEKFYLSRSRDDERYDEGIYSTGFVENKMSGVNNRREEFYLSRGKDENIYASFNNENVYSEGTFVGCGEEEFYLSRPKNKEENYAGFEDEEIYSVGFQYAKEGSRNKSSGSISQTCLQKGKENAFGSRNSSRSEKRGIENKRPSGQQTKSPSHTLNSAQKHRNSSESRAKREKSLELTGRHQLESSNFCEQIDEFASPTQTSRAKSKRCRESRGGEPPFGAAEVLDVGVDIDIGSANGQEDHNQDRQRGFNNDKGFSCHQEPQSENKFNGLDTEKGSLNAQENKSMRGDTDNGSSYLKEAYVQDKSQDADSNTGSLRGQEVPTEDEKRGVDTDNSFLCVGEASSNSSPSTPRLGPLKSSRRGDKSLSEHTNVPSDGQKSDVFEEAHGSKSDTFKKGRESRSGVFEEEHESKSDVFEKVPGSKTCAAEGGHGTESCFYEEVHGSKSEAFEKVHGSKSGAFNEEHGSKSSCYEDVQEPVTTTQREKCVHDQELSLKNENSSPENGQTNECSTPRSNQQQTYEDVELKDNGDPKDNVSEENVYDIGDNEPIYDVIDNALHRTIDETFDSIDDDDSDKSTSDLGEEEEDLYQIPRDLKNAKEENQAEKNSGTYKESQEILQNNDLVIIDKNGRLQQTKTAEEIELHISTPEKEGPCNEAEPEPNTRDGKTPSTGSSQTNANGAKLFEIERRISGGEAGTPQEDGVKFDNKNIEANTNDTVGKVRSMFERSASNNGTGCDDRRYHSIKTPSPARHIEICKTDAASQTFPRRPLNSKTSVEKFRLKSTDVVPKMQDREDNSKPPCHVLRITAEIAEYQRRSEDIKRMASLASGCLKTTKPELKDVNSSKDQKTEAIGPKMGSPRHGVFGPSSETAKQGFSENIRRDSKVKSPSGKDSTGPMEKSNIDDTKSDVITELSATFRSRQSGAMESGDEKSSTSFLEHSKILEKLKQSKQAGHETPRKSCPRESVTTHAGKTVHLRKPVLAKGFNVRKALQDKPRDFRVREHRPLTKHFAQETRVRSKSASAIPADGGDGESVSSETSEDSGVSNDSSVSSRGSQAYRQQPHASRGRSQPASSAYLGGTVDFARQATADAQDYDDTSVKWIDPEVLAKIRSVGTTVIFFGKRASQQNVCPGNDGHRNKKVSDPAPRSEQRRQPAVTEKCLKYDVTDSAAPDVKPRKSARDVGNHEVRNAHLIEARDATENIKFVRKFDDGSFTRRLVQSAAGTGDEEPIYDNVPCKEASKDIDFSAKSGGENVRKQLEIVLKTELRKCSAGEQDANGNFMEASRDLGKMRSQDQFALGNHLEFEDWNARTCKGKSVTRIHIRHHKETEEREAIMNLASETDTESSSSTGSTPRVVSCVRKE